MNMRDLIRRLEADFDVKEYLRLRDDRRESGANWAIDCPTCEGVQKLYVLVDDRGERPAGTWICFRCDESGGAFDLVRRLEGLDLFKAVEVLKSFSKAEESQDLAKVVAKAFAGFEPAPAVEDEPEPCSLPEEFVACAMGAQRRPKYLSERGITPVDAVRHGIGWCRTGHYGNRLVVPVRRGGKLRWFVARWMAKSPPPGVKKYLNSVGARSSQDLFGIDEARRCRRVVLVEDVFSKLAVGRSGLGTFGTHFSREQAALLAETDAEEVVVMWDEDTLRDGKAWKLATQLSEVWRVRVAELPRGKDPDDLPLGHLRRLVDESPILNGRSLFEREVLGRLDQF